MREMQDEWSETKTEWASYKDYIDNYFANLDVSEEVLAALRAMAADGTLNVIMDPVIASETAEWLAEHITPTTPAVDSSLTIAGAAADAKAAGDAIRNLITEVSHAFGLGRGTALATDTDLDALTEVGNYYSPNRATSETLNNSPFEAGYKLFVGISTATANVYQIALNTISNRIRMRALYNNTWSEWENIIKYSDLAPVLTDISTIKTDIEQMQTDLDILKPIIIEDSITWETSAAWPLGWRNAYWNTQTGEITTSNFYLATITKYKPDSSIKLIKCKAPENYGIRCSVFDANDVFIENIGDSSTAGSLTNEITVPVNPGYSYAFTVGRFSEQSAPEYLTSEFINQIITTTYSYNVKFKDKTGLYEWFSVDVDRPLSFGDEAISSDQETVECVLRLPDNYSATGEPVRLILACHGAHGYIQKSTQTWYNNNWKTFMDALLAAGYAVFDANVLPTNTGTDQMGLSVGSPLYVNVLKKAYDYIRLNYNVYPEIFVHGTSMGGAGASAFVNAYPQLVLAESSFAGRDITQYIKGVEDGDYDADNTLAIAWGYNNTVALKTDKWSHIDGSAPALTMHKYNNGLVQLQPERESDFNTWLSYFAEVQEHTQNDSIGDYTAFRSVPYKTWESWADNVTKTKAKLILKKAFTHGGTTPYEVIVYDTPTHTELSYGQVNNMIAQLIAWYKRWE